MCALLLYFPISQRSFMQHSVSHYPVTWIMNYREKDSRAWGSLRWIKENMILGFSARVNSKGR